MGMCLVHWLPLLGFAPAPAPPKKTNGGFSTWEKNILNKTQDLKVLDPVNDKNCGSLCTRSEPMPQML